jgi:LysM repeat protein
MAEPGTTFETPRACPFVALELDRDRRSDKPDYRHRCFAEPTPAPRSIAHQEAYCLSPNFAACPVFQDWAVRAAARPASAAAPGAAAASGPAMVGAAAADHDESVADVESEQVETAPPDAAAAVAAAPVEPVEAEPLLPPATAQLPEDASVTTSGAEIAAAAAASTGIAAAPTFATTGWDEDAEEAHQLAAFGTPPPPIDEDPHYDPPYDAHSSYGEPDAGYQEPPDLRDAAPAATAGAAAVPAFVPPPAQPTSPTPPVRELDADAGHEDAEAAAVPAFLASRSTRPASSTASANQGAGTNLAPPTAAPTTRDQLVPSWDLDSRYGAEPPPASESRGGGRLDGVLTAVAVIAILALGIAAVLFLPGLLNGKKPGSTPGGSFPVSSFVASPAPSLSSTLHPSAVPTVTPSVAPTVPPSVGPVASPRTYKIKAGDSLAKIANKFGVSVQDLLDANPDISNPNNIIVGQIIVIPAAAASP